MYLLSLNASAKNNDYTKYIEEGLIVGKGFGV